MDILNDIAALLAADVDTTWFLSFWILLLILATLETWRPAFKVPANRRSRWKANFGLYLLILIMLTATPVSSLLAANWARAEGIGLFNMVGLPGWLSFVATFFIRSFIGWVYHVANHKIPFLWRFHRVHHSDTHLDVTVGLRTHPFELAIIMPVMIAMTLALGLSPVAIVAYDVLESLNNLFNHSNVRVPERIDRWLRLIIVTPNMHTAHHSSWRPETDSNYSALISFWDRLFGTYTEAPRGGYEGMKVGLEEVGGKQASSFWWQLMSPLMNFRKLTGQKDTSAR